MNPYHIIHLLIIYGWYSTCKEETLASQSHFVSLFYGRSIEHECTAIGITAVLLTEKMWGIKPSNIKTGVHVQ